MPLDVTDADTDFEGVDDDVAMFLENLSGKKRPEAVASPEPDDEAVAEADIEALAETDEGATDEASEAETEAVAGADDPEVSFKIGDAETKVRMSELRGLVEKRETLATQEQAVQAAAQEFQARSTRVETALNTMLTKAQERFKPFKELDWLTVRTQVDDTQWEQLKEMASEAAQEVTFLETELDKHVAEAQAKTQATYAEAARVALSELTGPVDKGGIEGFNPDLYGKIVDHAVGAGMRREAVLQTTDAAVIRMLHKAMLYDQGRAKAGAVKERVTKVAAKPTDVRRPAAGGSPRNADSTAGTRALARLARTGSLEDATDAFLATMAPRDDD